MLRALALVAVTSSCGRPDCEAPAVRAADGDCVTIGDSDTPRHTGTDLYESTAGTGDTSSGATGDTGATVTTTTGPSSWACVDGAAFPSGGTTDPTLRKIVPVTERSGEPDLQLGTATLLRRNATSSFVRIALEITNTGVERACFVSFTDLHYTGASGVLATEGVGFVSGTVSARGSIYTDSCLRPGESGYFFEIDEVDFDAITGVSLAIDPPARDASPAAAMVAPQTYTVTGDTLDLVVTHTRGGDVLLDDTIRYLVTDATGAPVSWAFASQSAGTSTLGPGGTATYSDTAFALDTSGTRVCAWTQFTPSP